MFCIRLSPSLFIWSTANLFVSEILLWKSFSIFTVIFSSLSSSPLHVTSFVFLQISIFHLFLGNAVVILTHHYHFPFLLWLQYLLYHCWYIVCACSIIIIIKHRLSSAFLILLQLIIECFSLLLLLFLLDFRCIFFARPCLSDQLIYWKHFVESEMCANHGLSKA